MTPSSSVTPRGQKPRAVICDLDDTLYPEREYVRGGFRAVSAWAQEHVGIPADEGFQELEVLFPVHPRTRVTLDDLDFGPRVRLLDPLPYVDFLSLEAHAAAVLTDSGGIQEETTFLGIPCFTLRDNTERPITLSHGTNTLLGLDPARIRDILPALERPPRPVTPLPRWDGRAAERIAAAIERDYGAAPEATPLAEASA